MKITFSNPRVERLKANIFFFGILSIIIVVMWIGTSIYEAITTRQPDPEIDQLLTPLNPTLDLGTLRQYQDSQVAPAELFRIKVVTTKNRQVTTSTLDPFTDTTTPIEPIATSSSTSLE